MPVIKPFRRTCRQFTNGSYADSGHWMYVLHPAYAQAPQNYVRAFHLLQKDLLDLFDFVEPSDQNANCYSYRIHALLLRACVEVEANLRAILTENGYSRSGRWNMKDDYSKVNSSHRLSSYAIRVPNWHGTSFERRPFAPWDKGEPLQWYQTYNTTKHDRHEHFNEATFDCLIEAMCGLAALISAQFCTHDFSASSWGISAEYSVDGFEYGVGSHFLIKFPSDWPTEEQYEFDWQALKHDADPIQSYTYP